jgi:integrase
VHVVGPERKQAALVAEESSEAKIKKEIKKEEVAMALYRRGRKWWYNFTFRGKRVQKSTKVENRREAEKIEKGAWIQWARGEVGIADKPKAERKTIGQFLDALENDFKARKKDNVKNLNLIATVRKELGDRWADALTTVALTEYISGLRKPQKAKKGRRSKSLADSTIKHRLQILASAYELENRGREEAKLDPLIVPRFPKLSQDNARSGFLNRAPFDVLYSRLPEYLKDFALFAFLTGWRRNAIATLEWSDVRDGNVYLRGVYSKNKKPYYVPVLGELVQLIERRKEARSVETPQGIVLANLVFHHAGQPIVEFRKAWATACKKAGCEGRLFHDLRRSAARQLIRSGVTKDVARQLGGWKTDSMFSRYNVCAEEDLRDAMEKVTKYNEAESQKVVAIGANR